MNLIEVLFLLAAVLLSVVAGRYFVKELGLWGTLPAVLVGFGVIIGLLRVADILLRRRDRPNR